MSNREPPRGSAGVAARLSIKDEPLFSLKPGRRNFSLFLKRRRCHRNPSKLAVSMASTAQDGVRPMFGGLDLSQVRPLQNPAADWDFVKRLRDATTMKVLVKASSPLKTRSLPCNTGSMALSCRMTEAAPMRADEERSRASLRLPTESLAGSLFSWAAVSAAATSSRRWLSAPAPS